MAKQVSLGKLYFNCKLLYTVMRMVEMGKDVLQRNNVTDLSDVRWAAFSGNNSFHLQRSEDSL